MQEPRDVSLHVRSVLPACNPPGSRRQAASLGLCDEYAASSPRNEKPDGVHMYVLSCRGIIPYHETQGYTLCLMLLPTGPALIFRATVPERECIRPLEWRATGLTLVDEAPYNFRM